jgi:hypothetical protein
MSTAEPRPGAAHRVRRGELASLRGCKAVIGQRLRQSGMHWLLAGADAIITLRCREASCPDEQIWPQPRNQTCGMTTQLTTDDLGYRQN